MRDARDLRVFQSRSSPDRSLQFHVADRQNLVALFVFEFSALVVSRLSAREQRHAREALEERTNAEKLYELSRQTLTLDLHQQPGIDLIEQVVTEHADHLVDHPLHVSVSDRLLTAHADRDLLATIARQFVDNAFKYSYPGSDITISAEESASEVLIAVHNEGPLIKEQDRERIFERFYCCPDTEQDVQGTGIGLCVAKKAAEAQHGHVWVVSGEAEGTTFFLSIRGAKGGRNEHSQWQNSHQGELEYLRTFMSQIRIKIEYDPARPKYLLTEAYVGYRFCDGAGA